MSSLSQPRWELAQNKAEELAQKYSSPPIPIYEIAENNGLNVIFADFGKNAEKVAGVCDFVNSRMYVNRADSAQRQAFTMAHELGHWILHKEFFLREPDKYPVLPRFSEPDRDNIFEKEANKFAACLLVPAHLLKPVAVTPVSLLANIFGVSRTMMEFRLKNVE